MIARNAFSEIENWIENGKDALLVIGARQIGKTFTIRECLRRSGRHYVELNFIENPEYVDILRLATSNDDIYMRIAAVLGESLIKGETIIFFDEVQEYNDIVTRIKFLVDDGCYKYIMSGSLLGVELNALRSTPVGYMRILDMYPLSISEFFKAVGVSEAIWENVRECYSERVEVDPFIHKKLIDVFYLYLIVGGMPEAVQEYINSNDINRVSAIHEKIIRLYKQDFTKYERQYKLKLIEIYDALPGELNEKNKRFFISNVAGKTAFSRVENDFLWLKNAGVALPVYNVSEPTAPLQISEKRSLFKLFLSDVGLLTSLYSNEIKLKILRHDGDINNGALFENVAAQELITKELKLYYYNSKKYGELDFVIELDGKVLPIEIKSGKDYQRHRAMDNVLDDPAFAIHEGMVFCQDNVTVSEKCIYYPIYMLAFVENNKIKDFIYRLDLSGVN